MLRPTIPGGKVMYVKFVHAHTTKQLLEGAMDYPPDLFDYVMIGGDEYQIVERIAALGQAEQGPFNEKSITIVMTLFLEPDETSEEQS